VQLIRIITYLYVQLIHNYMERRYLKDLVEWNGRSDRKPLMIWGARQVGKTYLVKDIFAKTYYKGKHLYIDCRKESEICRFCENHFDAKEVFQFISLIKDFTINESTLIIFDEVQECPAIITLMKYICQDCREIPVIVTGSMVRIRIKRKKRGVSDGKEFLFPVGKINELEMTAMSFDEYLHNRNRKIYDAVVEAFNRKEPLLPEIHETAMKLFYEYLLVGGMPEAVDTFLRTNDFNESRRVLKELYSNYLDDMELYQASPESVIRSRAVFRSVYTQLSKESKNFSPSFVEKGARGRDMRSPVDWLSEAKVVNVSRQLSEHVTAPLIPSDDGHYRIYLSDVGMFSYQSGINPASFLSDDGRNMLTGVFYENFAAEELSSRGLELFYWCGKNNSEFEFVVAKDDTPIPIDVKKKTGPLKSLERFREHNAKGLAVKVSSNNYGFDKDRMILTIPFYQLFLFAEKIADDRIEIDLES